MEIRTILLATYIDLDNDVHPGVPLDTLQQRVYQRHVTPEDFAIAMQAAIHEGDLVETSRGIVTLSQSGREHYRKLVGTT